MNQRWSKEKKHWWNGVGDHWIEKIIFLANNAAR